MKCPKVYDIAVNYSNRMLSSIVRAYNLLKYKEHVIDLLIV